jgi:site-specific DNA recombinase
MAAPVRAAAIYARISSDQDGTTLGVQRQLEDCRKLAADLGWQVGDEYVDNDLSPTAASAAQEYERMLSDLADGTRDAVLIYHVDRLTRRPIEAHDALDVDLCGDLRRRPVIPVADKPSFAGRGRLADNRRCPSSELADRSFLVAR